MRIFVELLHDDVKMMKAIDKYQHANGRTPKKWEVTGGKPRYASTQEQLAQRKVFERLVVLEVVEHSRGVEPVAAE